MPNNIKILLQAGVNPNSQKNLEEDIRKLSEKIKETIKVKLEIDAKDIQIITKQLEEQRKKIKTTTVMKDSLFINKDVENQTINEITSRLREVRKNIDELAVVRNKYSYDAKGNRFLNGAELTYYNKELGQTIKETMGWQSIQKEVNGELQKTKIFGTTFEVITDNISKAKIEMASLVQYQQKMLGGEGFKGQLDIFADKNKGNYDPKLLENLRSQITGLSIDTPNLQSKIKQLNNEFVSLKYDATQAGGLIQRSFENLFKFMRFYVVGGMFVGFINDIKEAVKYVNELNASLTAIRVVTGMSKEEVVKLGIEYNNLAKQLGATTNEIAKGSVEWFRQGKTAAEAQELVKGSIMLSKLAAVDSAQATEYLTSTLNGYKKESSEAIDVISKMVAVDNTAATSVAELAVALQRSSNIASESGVGFERLLGYIGTISSVTRKSASTIGESFSIRGLVA